MYLVGIDVGTTNTKTVIFDVETGRICAIGNCRSMTRHPVAEWSEFEAEELWGTVLRSIQEAVRRCDHPERIQAISVASMGEAAFPLDADGNVLYPAIAWYDQRATAEAQWWADTVGKELLFTISGQNPQPIYGVNKLLWLRNHRPQIFERIRHWLNIEDFVLWKLSGNIATDYSIASRTMLFDQHTLTWSDQLLQQVALPAEWFAPAYISGTAIGTVRKEVAEALGFPRHVIVCTGGHDHLCGALAVGVTRPGHLLVSMGTASAMLAVGDTFRPDRELFMAGSTSYAYVMPHTYVTLGMLNFAGGALEWIITLLYGRDDQEAVTSEIYARALHEAANVPAGSRGAIILPSFLGSGTPYGQGPEHGAMLGLTPAHKRAELVRALMEGLAYWLRDNIQMFYHLGLVSPQPPVTVIGGITQATPLLQIKADVTGSLIKVPQITEAAATGAALLAGIGANVFSSGEEAASAVQHTVQTYEPDAQAVEAYSTIYEQTYLPIRRLFL
jgi:xylulokinase